MSCKNDKMFMEDKIAKFVFCLIWLPIIFVILAGLSTIFYDLAYYIMIGILLGILCILLPVGIIWTYQGVKEI